MEISVIQKDFMNETGAVLKAEMSVVRSRGKGLILETTAISVINWISQDKDAFRENIEKGIGFIVSSIERGGRFSTTQATVLCLKALVLYSSNIKGI